MQPGMWFWLIFFLCVVFGGWGYFRPEPIWPRYGVGLFLLLLLAMLGWSVFGGPVK